MINRSSAKRSNPEHALQVALKRHLDRYCKPSDAIWYAVPNGGKRHLYTAMWLQAEGVQKGVPDLCFILKDGRFAGLELKAAKGRPSQEQIDFGNRAMQLGALWAIAYSLDEALTILSEWGVLQNTRVAA